MTTEVARTTSLPCLEGNVFPCLSCPHGRIRNWCWVLLLQNKASLATGHSLQQKVIVYLVALVAARTFLTPRPIFFVGECWLGNVSILGIGRPAVGIGPKIAKFFLWCLWHQVVKKMTQTISTCIFGSYVSL